MSRTRPSTPQGLKAVKGRFVRMRSTHPSGLRRVVDHQVHEMDLIRVERLLGSVG